jgi:hypothetical protein
MITDRSPTSYYPYTGGASCIEFRDTAKPSHLGSLYVLNAIGDTWFRCVEPQSIAFSYGLAIESIRLTSNRPVVNHSVLSYKAKITFIPHADEFAVEEGLIWLHVHQDHTVEEVFKFIKENKDSWIP